MSAANDKAQAFVAGLAGVRSIDSLAEVGRQAMADLPVPTRKSERWKYSPLTPMLATPVRTAPAPEGWPADADEPHSWTGRLPRRAAERPRGGGSLRPARCRRRGACRCRKPCQKAESEKATKIGRPTTPASGWVLSTQPMPKTDCS